MQEITSSQFEQALAAREKVATEGGAAYSTGVRRAQGDEPEMRRTLDEHRVDSARESSNLKETFRLAAQSRYEAVKYLGAAGARIVPSTALLDEPFMIWATWTPHHLPHSNILEASEIEPRLSWAKIDVEQSSAILEDHQPIGLVDRLSFYYLWENEAQSPVVVDVSSYMTLWGHWQGFATYYKTSPEDPFPGSGQGSAHMNLSANLALYEWWNQPPTLAPLQNLPDQQTQVSILNLVFTAGVGQSRNLFDGVFLKQSWVVIPAGGALVAEVSLDADHFVNHGSVHVDFSSDDFQITSHWVEVKYVVGPPGLTTTPVFPGFAIQP